MKRRKDVVLKDLNNMRERCWRKKVQDQGEKTAMVRETRVVNGVSKYIIKLKKNRHHIILCIVYLCTVLEINGIF